MAGKLEALEKLNADKVNFLLLMIHEHLMSMRVGRDRMMRWVVMHSALGVKPLVWG